MRYCCNCEFNDGFIYPTMPPKYKCTITNQYHFGNFDCNLELAPVVKCKDCKWYNSGNADCWCFWVDTLETDYCSMGERKEDGNS